MMYVLKEEDLPQFIESLRQFFPTSLQIFCQARNILRKKCFWPGTEVVVDQYPNYAACMTRPIPGSEEYIPRPRNWVQCVTIFARTGEALKNLLNEENVIDWYRHICFFSAVPSNLIPVILQRADLFGHTKKIEDSFSSNVFLIRPEDLEQKKLPALPVGYRIGKLEVGHIEQVLREWKKAGCEGDAHPFLHYLITNEFPTSAIFNEKNELISFSIYSPNGSISQGFVREDCRNRGFFQIVNNDLAKKIFAELQQEITWAHVNNANVASRKSFLKLGAKMDPDWHTQVLEYMPYM